MFWAYLRFPMIPALLRSEQPEKRVDKCTAADAKRGNTVAYAATHRTRRLPGVRRASSWAWPNSATGMLENQMHGVTNITVGMYYCFPVLTLLR